MFKKSSLIIIFAAMSLFAMKISAEQQAATSNQLCNNQGVCAQVPSNSRLMTLCSQECTLTVGGSSSNAIPVCDAQMNCPVIIPSTETVEMLEKLCTRGVSCILRPKNLGL